MTVAELSERFHIPNELLESANVRHSTDAEVQELLGVHGRSGQDLSGIVFPYRDPRDGRVLSHRVRLDTPVGDGQKYLSEQGCRTLFFPPIRDSALTDISHPAVIVESEKAALALTALADRHRRSLLVVAIGGVYGWRRKIGVESTPDGERETVTGASPSFDWVVWQGRKVIIAFDSNVEGRRDLEKARRELANELLRREAQVLIARVPKRDSVNGPDDLIVIAGDRAALHILDSAAPFAPATATRSIRTGFVLTRLDELLNKSNAPIDYVLGNTLVVGGVSGVFAKPKVGKSTFARNLCLAVARGEDFLGLKTKKGECVYLALEEREEDIRQDFRAMGADGSEPIYVHAANAPAEGIAALCDLVRERKPILVVIDPLFRLARIRDEKAYAETYTALGPLIDVAREIGTHVMFTHHAGKGMKADSVDSPLGSTAIGGVVSTLVVLKRTSNHRTIETIQRVGADVPGTVLEFDFNTRRLALGKTRLDSERQDCEMEILAFLDSASDPQTQEQIRDGVEGQTRVIRAALTALVAAGRVDRTGEGKKGKPFLYAFQNSGSQHITGTRKPESESQGEVTEKNGQIPVPENSQDSMVVSDVEQGDDEVRL
jgi:hypothetical protein